MNSGVELAEKFTDLCEKAGLEMTAETALRCIELAKQAMQDGVCSVEAYFQAKYLIVSQVPVANEWIN